MYIGFTGSSNEAEIINVKSQIINILKDHGYHNIENFPGIRVHLGLPYNQITLMKNQNGGITFHIPPANM